MLTPITHPKMNLGKAWLESGGRNCQNCVIAGVRRFFGVDVDASPHKVMRLNDGLFLEEFFGGKFRVSNSLVNDWGSLPLAAQGDHVRLAMRGAGPGSVGVVSSSGHVFFGVNIGGEVRFYDFQVQGARVDWTSWADDAKGGNLSVMIIPKT